MAATMSEKECQQNLIMAAVSCVILGVGMMLWGIAPILIERLATGKPPQLEWMHAVNGVVMLLGVSFLGLALLIPNGTRWAIWAAYITSLALCAMAVTVAFFIEAQPGCLFVIILSGSCTFSSWLALGAAARRRAAIRESLLT